MPALPCPYQQPERAHQHQAAEQRAALMNVRWIDRSGLAALTADNTHWDMLQFSRFIEEPMRGPRPTPTHGGGR